MSEHYVEAHVTLDPVSDPDDLVRLDRITELCGFRRAKLTMDNGRPWGEDTFLTWRGDSLETAERRIKDLVTRLQENSVWAPWVRRYKVEMTLVDSRELDKWGLL